MQGNGAKWTCACKDCSSPSRSRLPAPPSLPQHRQIQQGKKSKSLTPLQLTPGFKICPVSVCIKARHCLAFKMRTMMIFFTLSSLSLSSWNILACPVIYIYIYIRVFWRKFQADYLESGKAIKWLRTKYESRIPSPAAAVRLLKRSEVPSRARARSALG